MSRRLLLLLLATALVGTMVGVGAAAATRNRAQRQPVAAAAEPATSVVDDRAEAFELSFSREPSGLKETELAKAKPKPKETEPAKPEYDVAAVQRKLTELKYYVGPIDGEAGLAMSSAVMAFQKVQGIGADGSIGEQTLAALKDPVQPSLRGSASSRIEVDLTKQVLYFVEGGSLARILPVSSGSGADYTTSSGGTATSLTPVGSYAIQRKIPGTRVADLGELYDPMYFYEGWAIHGSNSVPAYPASHGCIRVTRADALWLYPKTPVGFPVMIYGGTYTFEAGSSAPGTSNPAGDTAEDSAPAPEEPSDDETTEPKPKPEPEPEPEPTRKPRPKPSDEPEPEPEPTKKPDPAPTDEPTEDPLP
jgi:lipoprotein-anchoring transpeptidase ErfK/SrfK